MPSKFGSYHNFWSGQYRGAVATGDLTRTSRRAQANRSAIIAAAEALLVEGGEQAVTIDAVAARADVAVQTVYNRVGNRSAVLIAVAERALEENRQFMDAAYAHDGTPLERVRRAGAAYAQFATQSPHQFRILVDPPREPDALERVAELTREQNAKLAQALRDGAADGSMRADLDPELTADVLWTAMNGMLALAWRTDALRADAARLKALRRTFDAIIVGGLSPDGGTP
jgi:AcrR family transcriptional regulator